MKDLKLISTEKLTDVAKLLNPIIIKAGGKPIAVSKPKAAVLDAFTKGVESFPPETKLPAAVIKFYNDIYADEIDQPADTPEAKTKKTQPAKAPKADKPAKEPKEKKEALPKDEYGFREGSNGANLMLSLKEGPMKMSEIKQEPWNTSHSTFYELFNKLKAEGILDMNEEKQIFIVAKKKK